MLKEIHINDNITLSYIPVKKLKTTSMGIYIYRPLKKEEASFNALLPHILKNGCNMCKSREEIAHFLENLYGAKMSAGISKKGNNHILCFEGETISDKYAAKGEALTKQLMRLLLSIIFDTKDEFDADIFETEKRNSVMKIENIINDKRIYANYRCIEEMSRGDVFEIPRLGYAEDMRNADRSELYVYYKYIITSSPVDIYVCGDTDIDAIASEIQSFVSRLDFCGCSFPENTLINEKGSVNSVTEDMNVTQGKLSMGFLTGIDPVKEDTAALVLANTIFGGGAQSKLFNNVREKLSLAYYAGSVLNKGKGFLTVNAGIESDNFEKTKSEILVQLEDMKKGNISELEMEASKNFIINSLNSYYDDQYALIAYYQTEKLSGTNTDIDEYKEKISKLTKDDVVKAFSGVKLDTVYFIRGVMGNDGKDN